jgi:hypothetical protein
MDQSVMNFASEAARSSAIPTPTEGMLALTKDNDEIDYYNGSAWVPALPIGAWQSWSPVLSDGWTNGNGTWQAYYTQIGKTVHVRGVFTTGNGLKGSTMGCSLPVTASSTHSGPTALGVAGMTIGGVIYSGRVLFQSTGTVRIYIETANTTWVQYANVSATSPASWAASGDIIRFSFTYEAA